MQLNEWAAQQKEFRICLLCNWWHDVLLKIFPHPTSPLGYFYILYPVRKQIDRETDRIIFEKKTEIETPFFQAHRYDFLWCGIVCRYCPACNASLSRLLTARWPRWKSTAPSFFNCCRWRLTTVRTEPTMQARVSWEKSLISRTGKLLVEEELFFRST